ncbi:MAG: hypothetical protein K5697_13395 [Lachnospiraceae bacterium]|nr:hypothetical protein [Lachnospiraceae bacterium]
MNGQTLECLNSFSTYDSHSELCGAIRLIKGIRKPGWGYFLRAESFYNVATAEDEYSKYGGRPQHLHERSHGEIHLCTYEETDSFRVTEMFINNREQILKRLLEK